MAAAKVEKVLCKSMKNDINLNFGCCFRSAFGLNKKNVKEEKYKKGLCKAHI